MKHEQDMPPIPKDIAQQLCAEIREANRGKWGLAALQCWGCVTFSKGDPARMCAANRPDYRGCNRVNARFDRLARTKAG
jgi:hypothetical protein